MPSVSYRSLATPLLLALTLALGACGSVKLHSDVRQKQGEDLAKAWKEVDLKAWFDAERANQAKLLEAEIAGADRRLGDLYEGEVRALARMPVGQWRRHYLERLEKVVGSLRAETPARDFDDQQIAELGQQVDGVLDPLDDESTAAGELARAQSFLQSLGVPAFNCAQRLEKTEVVQAWAAAHRELAADGVVGQQMKRAADKCRDIVRARAAHRAGLEALLKYITRERKDRFSGGELKQRIEAWKSDQDQLLRRTAEVDAAGAEVARAQLAYDAALAQGAAKASEIPALAGKLADALDKLGKVQGALGLEEASRQRLKRLDDLLTAVADGKELDSATSSKLEVAISLFPKIADALQAVRDQKPGVAAVPLLIQRDVEQARLSSATVEAARLKQAVEIEGALVLATVRQVQTLLRANKLIVKVMPSGQKLLADTAAAAAVEAKAAADESQRPGATPESINEADNRRTLRNAAALDGVWTRLDPIDRRWLLESSVYYLDAYSRQQSSIRAAETTLRAMEAARNVDLSEVNASLWLALINASVGQTVEYSALGLKASDFEKLLNLLTLGYIGHGVNK